MTPTPSSTDSTSNGAPSVTSSELESLRHQLESERDLLLAHAESVADEEDENASSATHGQGETEHTTNEVERRVNAVLEANTDHALEEIALALGRIEGGTYGICENCGVQIPRERLAAIPAARLCVKCQESLSTRN